MIWIFTSFFLLAALCCFTLYRFDRRVYFFVSLPIYLFLFFLQILRVGGPDYYSYKQLFDLLAAQRSWGQVWSIAFANGWYEPYQIVVSYVLGTFDNQYSSMLLFDGVLVLISNLFAQFRFKYFPFYLLISFPFYFANILAVRLSVSIAVVILLYSALPESKSFVRAKWSSALYVLPLAIHFGSIFFIASQALISTKLHFRLSFRSVHLLTAAFLFVPLTSAGFYYVRKYSAYAVEPPSFKLVVAALFNVLLLFLLVRRSNRLVVYFPFVSLMIVSILPLSQRALDLLLVGSYFLLISDISRSPHASRNLSVNIVFLVPMIGVYGLLRLISQADYLSAAYAPCFFCGLSGF